MRIIGCDIGTRYAHFIAVSDDGPPVVRAARIAGDPVELLLHALERIKPGPLGDTDIVITLSPALTGFAPVGSLCTAGFGDLPVLHFPELEPLLPRHMRLEVAERLDARGRIAHELDGESLQASVQSLTARGAQAIAVSFLHADLNPDHERKAIQRIRNLAPKLMVTAGHLAAPVGDDASRTAAAIINAAMMPGTAGLIARLRQAFEGRSHRGILAVMAATGGALPTNEAADRPIEIGQGTQAAGIAGAAYVAAGTGHATVAALDVGASGAVTGLIRAGRPLERSNSAGAAGLPPIRVTRLDANPLAVGGETPVWVDDAGLLRVEASAFHTGSAISLGGQQVTLMDLQAALGRLDPTVLAVGDQPVPPESVRAAVMHQLAEPLETDLEVASHAALRVAVDRLASGVQRTLDSAGRSRDGAVLAPVGGAGPMLGVAVARRLGIDKLIVPATAGLSGALGCAGADHRLDRASAVEQPLDKVDAGQLRDLMEAHVDDCSARLAGIGLDVSDALISHTVEFRQAGAEQVLTSQLPGSKVTRDQLKSLSDIAFRGRFGVEPAAGTPTVSAVRTSVVINRPAIVLGNLIDADARKERLADALIGYREVWFDRAPRPVDPDEPEPAGNSLGAAAWVGTPVYRRDRLPTQATIFGPAIIEAPHTTIVIEPLNHVQSDRDGTLTISIALNIAQDAEEEAA